jgi:hypothetical protein
MTRQRSLFDVLLSLKEGYVPINIHVVFENNIFSNKIFVTCQTAGVYDMWLDSVSDNLISSKKRDDCILISQLTFAHQSKKNVSFNFDVSTNRLRKKSNNPLLDSGVTPNSLLEKFNDTSKSSTLDTLIQLELLPVEKKDISIYSYFTKFDALSSIPLFLLHTVKQHDSVKFVPKLRENKAVYQSEFMKIQSSPVFKPSITVDEFISLGLKLKEENVSIERIGMLFYRLDIKEFASELIISNMLEATFGFYKKSLRYQRSYPTNKEELPTPDEHVVTQEGKEVHYARKSLRERLKSISFRAPQREKEQNVSNIDVKANEPEIGKSVKVSAPKITFTVNKLESFSMFELNSDEGVTINSSHNFYQHLYSKCSDEQKLALQRFIYPMVKLLDETNNPQQVKIYETYLENLGDYIDELLDSDR